MRMAPVVVKTCTFCFAVKGTDVAATTPLPITLKTYENGRFTFSYDPDGHGKGGEETKAWGCDQHADHFIGQFADFVNDAQSIVDAVHHEENPPEVIGEEEEEDEEDVEEEETPEESFANQGDVNALLARVQARTEGAKVTPPSPSSVVNNPRPDQVDDNAKVEVVHEWQTWFPGGYTPNTKAPESKEEKEECQRWFLKLPRRLQDEYTKGKGWPTRRWPTPLIEAWYTSKHYAEYAGHIPA